MDLRPFQTELHERMAAGFETPENLRTWFKRHVPEENEFEVFTSTGFGAQVFDVLTWAKARDRTEEILQALVDDPPPNDNRLPILIHVWTKGVVISAATRQRGIPPIDPHNDWFVTRRPFVNRAELRRELERLATAPAGPDSLLIIEGPDYTGKSLSIQFAARCAPQKRFVVIDLDDWGGRNVLADELAASMYRKSLPPPVDPSKELREVTTLKNWLMGHLHESGYWILIDHCNRPSLTAAAAELLKQVIADIERGFLTGVRLILADIDRAALSNRLANSDRRDVARLPTREHVDDWLRRLATHMQRAYDDDAITAYVEEVFSGLPPVITGPDLAAELEERLLSVFVRIQALGGTDDIEERQIA